MERVIRYICGWHSVFRRWHVSPLTWLQDNITRLFYWKWGREKERRKKREKRKEKVRRLSARNKKRENRRFEREKEWHNGSKPDNSLGVRLRAHHPFPSAATPEKRRVELTGYGTEMSQPAAQKSFSFGRFNGEGWWRAQQAESDFWGRTGGLLVR